MHDEAVIFTVLSLVQLEIASKEGPMILTSEFVRECVETCFRHGFTQGRRDSLYKALCLSLKLPS